MTPALRIATWATAAAVGGTGLVYAWMAYLMAPAAPDDLVNHPWQPDVLHLHVLAAPVWLVVLGALWQGHVLPKLRAGPPTRRRSGIALAVLAVVMAGSGYLLQTAVDDAVRSLWRSVHVASSLAWLLALGGHVLARVRAEAPARDVTCST